MKWPWVSRRAYERECAWGDQRLREVGMWKRLYQDTVILYHDAQDQIHELRAQLRLKTPEQEHYIKLSQGQLGDAP